MNVIGKLTKAWHIIRCEGILPFLSAVKERLYFRHKSIWFELFLKEIEVGMKLKFNGRLDFDHPGNVCAWIKKHDIPGTNDTVEISRMKDRGHLFVGLLEGESIIGYMKIGWDLVYVLDYHTDIQLSDGDYFIIDIYIIPEKRGMGAGTFLTVKAAHEMKSRGYKRGIMHVRLDKTSMVRTGYKVGYREIGRVNFMSIFGFNFFRPHPMAFIKKRVSTL